MYQQRKRLSFGDLFGLLFFVAFVGMALVIFWRYNLHEESPSNEIVTLPAASQASTPAAHTTDTQGDSTPQPVSLNTLTNAHIQIPAAGINATIVQVYLDGVSWDVSELGMNVGHLEGTAWISPAPGNIVLSGHVELRDGRKGIFARIGDLSEGDIIILRHNETERRYVVSSISTVEPTDLSPVYPTTEDRLTLITCDDYSFFQNSYQTRVIVVADRIS